ncbi:MULTISPECIES: 3-oxoacyl-ACP reductase family protein [unclassified Paenibacillus]|uniref:3-oxoacyl-ACP reductase family protein n=1 Tax=unclassified Paenibacillus TaxID=185978 RepID=UPI001042CCEF|nr:MULTISPECIES: 3-oxoacyl-ACP reductase family protein [unclassified Paenibacillus]NIK67017.1 3-oxoacyl-[acyl-carrier protein] reductase [Paenibacillus sp. BK720]TCN01069.1 3-oxoacyl-[acyl-carrier protein] reductase [Paenibacillus sp. BK033]
MNSNKLQGKTAFVTGGSRGIGASIVRRLSQEGAAVAFTYANSVEKANELVTEIQTAGGRALALQAKGEDIDSVKSAVGETIHEFGHLNILVNNAGILDVKPYDQFTMEDFDRTVTVNIKAVFAAIQAAGPQMRHGDRIINIGSVNADVTGFPGMSLYSMSKAAVAAMTRGLARDLAPQGVTVNNIQPGPVDTDMNPAEGEMAAILKNVIALGRYGTVNDIASLVAFLSSPEAGYITGASLDINGGFMI